MSLMFGEQSWPQLKEHLDKNALIILPVGTTEEHGPHLPVDTDARIAQAYGLGLTRAASSKVPVLLMDTMRYGYSMKIMKNWPGTVIVRSRVFMDMIFDISKSVLDMGFRKLVILDCHGHHSGPLNTVSRELCDACDKSIAIISPAVLSRDVFTSIRKSPQGGAIHAGEWETSLLLHIDPELVDMSKATDVDTMNYHSDFVAGDGFTGKQSVTWSTWYLQKSVSGTYGTPTVATAETGKKIMEAAVERGVKFLEEFWARPEFGEEPQ